MGDRVIFPSQYAFARTGVNARTCYHLPVSRASIYLCLAIAAQTGCTRSAVRVDGVSGILDAFTSHHIVALGEGMHGNNQAHAFRLALVRDPRFPSLVNDIVVESGTAGYQSAMDRFVRGEDVPYAELRHAWQDTTNPTPIWDTPIYEEFFRAVRQVNASLPDDRKLRVLLGDPPVDWDAVRTKDDVVRLVSLRVHVVDVINKEVLSKNRRALVVYGDGHFLRYNRWVGTPSVSESTLNRIEALGTKAFNVWTNTTVEMERMQRDIASWPVPSLAKVRGTRLGRLDFKYFSGIETDPRTKMEDQFDAVLYLGPPSSITQSELPASLCADAEYMKMRAARLFIAWGEDGVASLKKECATHTRTR